LLEAPAVHDAPTPAELLSAVARLLREEFLPVLDTSLAYKARVAANALDLAARQLDESSEIPAAENKRLERLIGESGDTVALTRALVTAIEKECELPDLEAHLLATTLAKLAVDQPRYAGIGRAEKIFGVLPLPQQDLP
jgi:hypothetical protein